MHGHAHRQGVSRGTIDRVNRFLILLSDAHSQIVSDFGRVLDAMDVATRLLVVQLVNSEMGAEENKLPRGLLRYFRPYMRPTAHASPFSKLVYVDSPIVYAALAVRYARMRFASPPFIV